MGREPAAVTLEAHRHAVDPAGAVLGNDVGRARPVRLAVAVRIGTVEQQHYAGDLLQWLARPLRW
jgi:hypothetical protein